MRLPNEALQPTALSGLPCDRLASATRSKHLFGWSAARRG